jgi:hypothetical protein
VAARPTRHRGFNVTFGTPELIIALFALEAGLHEVVTSVIIHLGNILPDGRRCCSAA